MKNKLILHLKLNHLYSAAYDYHLGQIGIGSKDLRTNDLTEILPIWAQKLLFIHYNHT